MRARPTVHTDPSRASSPRRSRPVCGRTTGGPSVVCFCCRTVAGQLGLPLVPLVALTEYRVGDRAHRRLRAYKDAPVAEVRDRSRSALVTELADRCADPPRGTVSRLGPWQVVTTVPSSHRPGGAPAEGLVDGEDLGWVGGTFVPAAPACNPHGIVQAGVHGLLLDAAMNFAINAALPGKARTRATLEMKVETMRPAQLAEAYRLRGEVVRLARQVASA